MNAIFQFVYQNISNYRNLAIAIFGALISFNAIAANEQISNELNAVIKGNITITDKNGSGLIDHSNVVVFVDGLSHQQNILAEQSVPKMSHKGLQFTPKVLPIIKGGDVNFFNDDHIFHNVFSLSKAKTFDLGIYPTGSEKIVRFDQPGLVKVYCNIHPNMISNILVLNNSLFSLTDANGNYEIKNVPAGIITLRVWHELGGDIRREMTIQNNDLLIEDFTISKTKNIKQHKNKFGMPYRKKY